jgi:hypothetical protein
MPRWCNERRPWCSLRRVPEIESGDRRAQTSDRGSTTTSVSVHASYDAAGDGVMVVLAGKAAFAAGGRLVVVGTSPGGITDVAGDYLDRSGQGVPGTDAVFTIAPKARGILSSGG